MKAHPEKEGQLSGVGGEEMAGEEDGCTDGLRSTFCRARTHPSHSSAIAAASWYVCDDVVSYKREGKLLIQCIYL